MMTTTATPRGVQQHAVKTARQVAEAFPGAHPGHAQVSEHGMQWEILIPAARGEYRVTLTVSDNPDVYDRAVSVAVFGSWDGTDGEGFAIPGGGYSQVFDFGEPVKIQHALLASHIVEAIRTFETNSPALALAVSRGV